MQKYELLLVLPGTFDEKESENEANRALTVVKDHCSNATMVALGKNRLAYPIKQIRYGYFYTIIFEAESEKIKELKGKLDLDKNILRSFITKYNEKMSQAQKISYFSAEGKKEAEEGMTEERKAFESARKEEAKPRTEQSSSTGEETKSSTQQISGTVEKPMDMKDIDKKLDEILADDNLMTKV